jgi:hypothetical protein
MNRDELIERLKTLVMDWNGWDTQLIDERVRTRRYCAQDLIKIIDAAESTDAQEIAPRQQATGQTGGEV